jgi:hypothetical protein
MFRPISRRRLLRGAAGTIVGLPFLEVMTRPVAVAQTSAKPPARLVWIHTESGMWMPKYKPARTGREFDLSYTLEPLAAYRKQMTVLSGLRHENAFKRNPQTGRHVQDGMCHLTGADLGSTPGVAVRNSVSIDQLAAEAIGENTRLPVLNLTVDRAGTLSYTSAGTPVPSEWDPRVVFAQLFADNSPEAKKHAAARFERNASILDDVLESTRDLSRKLSETDRKTVDEYLTNLREVERRARVARDWSDRPAVSVPNGVMAPGPPPEKDRTAYVRVILDMLVLALQTDQTRLATARIGFMGCQYPDIGCPDNYHGYTHHDFNKARQDAMAMIDRHRISHLAHFLDKLAQVKEGDSSLLDSCLIHYGAGMGAEHDDKDLPNLIVGGGLGHAGHIDYGNKPLASLYLLMLERAGIKASSFADSSEPLSLG